MFAHEESTAWRDFIEGEDARHARLDSEEQLRLQNEENIDTQNLSTELQGLQTWGAVLTHISNGQSQLADLQAQLANVPPGSAQATKLQGEIDQTTAAIAASQTEALTQAKAMLGPTQDLAAYYDKLVDEELIHLYELADELSQPLSDDRKETILEEANADYGQLLQDSSADYLVNVMAQFEQQYIGSPNTQPAVSEKLQAIADKLKAQRDVKPKSASEAAKMADALIKDMRASIAPPPKPAVVKLASPIPSSPRQKK